MFGFAMRAAVLFSRKKAGMASYALAVGGGGGGGTASSDFYHYGNDTVISGANLAGARAGLAGVGNKEKAVFAGSSDTSNNFADFYTHSNNTFTRGGTLSQWTMSRRPAAAGNSILGIFRGGFQNDYTYKYAYNYASSTMSFSSSVGTDRGSLAATGNSTRGYWAGGMTGTTSSSLVDTYYYANATASSTTSLNTVRNLPAATGNTVFGLFVGGMGSTGSSQASTNRFQYSNNAVTNGTSLANAKFGAAAAGTAEVGLVIGGNDADPSKVEKYDLVAHTVKAGTNLGIKRVYLGAVSSTPGHL